MSRAGICTGTFVSMIQHRKGELGLPQDMLETDLKSLSRTNNVFIMLVRVEKLIYAYFAAS